MGVEQVQRGKSPGNPGCSRRSRWRGSDAPNPTSRAFFGSSRQAIEVQQTLQSLESEFDLPAQAIHGEKFVGGIGLGVQGGRQHDKSGGEQAARIENLALLARLAQQTLALGLRGLLGFALDDDARSHRAPAPSTETTRSSVTLRRHVPQVFGQIELLVVGPAQTQRTPAQPDQIVGIAGLADALAQAPQALGVRIIAVAEPDFSANRSSAIECFGAVLVRQLEMAEAAAPRS